jgi:hypothetical protein
MRINAGPDTGWVSFLPDFLVFVENSVPAD